MSVPMVTQISVMPSQNSGGLHAKFVRSSNGNYNVAPLTAALDMSMIGSSSGVSGVGAGVSGVGTGGSGVSGVGVSGIGVSGVYGGGVTSGGVIYSSGFGRSATFAGGMMSGGGGVLGNFSQSAVNSSANFINSPGIGAGNFVSSGAANNFVNGNANNYINYNDQLTEMRNALAEVRKESRDAQIRNEAMRHRSPQIKRSMTFLMDVNFKIEDLSDNLSRVIQSFTSGVGDINDVINLNSHVELIKEKVKEEMEANMIASTSKHKWKTVKQFQNNSIFKDDPVEVQEDKSKRLRKAEYEAARFPKPAKGQFKRKGQFSHQDSAAKKYNSGEKSDNSSEGQGPKCYNCKLFGHKQWECPRNK